jgi:GTP cyclohydrolase FolE2
MTVIIHFDFDGMYLLLSQGGLNQRSMYKLVPKSYHSSFSEKKEAIEISLKVTHMCPCSPESVLLDLAIENIQLQKIT